MPLHLFATSFSRNGKNQTPLAEIMLAIDCTQTRALDKYEMRFCAIYFAECDLEWATDFFREDFPAPVVPLLFAPAAAPERRAGACFADGVALCSWVFAPSCAADEEPPAR
ncbi:MAG TPA: hypothetical protein VMQ76_01490, partial [Terracidiphilus sp.]|nr:hypothetical protein [Terracidiphilus sp.]